MLSSHRLRPRAGEFAARIVFSFQMFVDIGHAVLQYRVFPFFSRDAVAHHFLISVVRDQLSGLLFNGHTAYQVVDTLLYLLCRVFVHVLFPVFVQVYPSFLIDVALFRENFLRGQMIFGGQWGCQHEADKSQHIVFLRYVVASHICYV